MTARMQAPNDGPVVGVADEKVERMLGHGYTVVDGDGPTPAHEPPSGGETLTPPPLGGKGSGEDAWRTYAEQQSVDVSDAENREAVMAKLREAGKPVEPTQE